VKALPPRKPLQGPDWYPIAQIHRAADGLITFHKKVQGDQGEEWKNLFSICAADLQQYFPEFVEEIEQDAYFSLHTFWKPEGVRWGIQRHYTPRRQDRLQWLNVAWVDCDTYNVGATWAAAVGVVQGMQDEGLIPPASFLVRSGRGLWLLWLLRGEGDSSLGERAYYRNRQLWAKVQRELASRLRILGADTTAGDGARVARVPGSINTKSGERVAYLLQSSRGGRGFSYTLPELASHLGLGPGAVEAPPPILPRSRRKQDQVPLPLPPGEKLYRPPEKKKTPKQLRGMKGWQARAKHRLENFVMLRDLRGGFAEGHRNRAARLYAGMLWAAGYRGEELRGMVEEFSRKYCKPPLYPSDVSGAVRGAGNRECWAIRVVTIAEWLSITPDEAQLLSGWPAKGEKPPAPPAARRKPEADRRRELEAEVIRTYGRVPPLRALQAHLAERGVEAVLQTIQRDLKALGIGNPRARRGKQLPLDLVHN
jgi:hypothetical protein